MNHKIKPFKIKRIIKLIIYIFLLLAEFILIQSKQIILL